MLFAVASLGAATDSTAQTCLESVYLGFAEAQRAWQVSLKNLIVSARPDYDELVSLSAELQLAMIEENQARFMYLITQQSDRVRSAGDLSQLVNLGGAQWTSGDEKAGTTQLVEAGKLLDMPMYDHVIVGGDRYFSFAEAGLL